MRQIICADALQWLEDKRDLGAIITSLPDAGEVAMVMSEWRVWFSTAVSQCVQAASPDQPCIFYQTDRKSEGHVESKALLVLEAARARGARLLWHKVVLRREPGTIDLHRPGFTHLIAVSVEGKPGPATPDVMHAGVKVYPNAMGLTATNFAIRFAQQSGARAVVDPFCGRGTVPAVAEARGVPSIGVDIDEAQCERARQLRLALLRPQVAAGS